MAMAVDSRQQAQFSNMGYEGMRYAPAPQFTNPWVSGPATTQSQMYATSMPQTSAADYKPQVPTPASNVSTAYSSAQVSDGMSAPRPYGASYTTTAAPSGAMYAPTSAPQYSADILQRTSPYSYDRRSSHPLQHGSEAERQSFSDALDASRGMVAMSQSDITPRNIYGNPQPSRTTTDSYGFPSSHSSHSSISSASTYPTYYNSSVSEASVGDYSSASESVDMPNSRSLPRPTGLMGGPPAPSSMMGQFSSKVSSSSQKKHKCKICDKRFTRPSSLQTHMYSHTGEKPFACDVDGCGRHFSVVSNLRRHRKVHKGEGRDHPSPDEDED